MSNEVKYDPFSRLAKTYKHRERDGTKCITKLFINKLNKFKIKTVVTIQTPGDRHVCKYYKSRWLAPGDYLGDGINFICIFVRAIQQIWQAIFDYYHLIVSPAILRYDVSNQYNGYFTSINSGNGFRQRFTVFEKREFWLNISDDFKFTIYNVQCIIPKACVNYIHSFELDDWHDVLSVIIRREYPMSQLYKWIIEMISEHVVPRLLCTLNKHSSFKHGICKIIASYMIPLND